MSAGHTPGPWVVCATHDDERFFSVFTKHQLDNDQINSVTSDDFVVSAGLNHDNFEANARLIAAAPELLEVLIEVDRENSAALAGMKDDDIQPPNWFVDQCQKVKDAITKATGETA